jgi:alpha-1,3-rhamnosyltransferase
MSETAAEENQDHARVSVVVPSHNHSAFVERTLQSIFRQSVKPAELIVIDDGSTDDSTQIIERVLRNCSFPCELIARGNRGLCATLNEGLAKTHEKYFAYLGSDDLWLPDFLSTRVRTLESRPVAALAYGHAFLINEADQIIDCTSDWANYVDGNARDMLLQANIAPMSPTVLHRRAALERHGWNEKARLEDYELYLRLSAEGEFAFDPRILSAWRQHEANTSRDFVWMIEARLHAQQTLARQLRLSATELEHAHLALKFSGAEDLLRLGEKGQSLEFLRQGWRGAPSAAALARVVLRLLAPYSLTKWRRRRRRERATKRYGPLSQRA